MERLTLAYIDSDTIFGRKYIIDKGVPYKEDIKRLGELEDKLESGLLLELPCNIGDTIYYIEYFCRYKGCSADTQSYCCGCKEMIERERKHEKYVIAEKKFELRDFSSIGKKYFTKKPEAERRLAELKGEAI